jgi:hypothetical protein
MSISLGLYDIFSNIIPGLLYLFVFYELFGLLKINTISFSNSHNTIETISLFAGAFILGHIFNTFTFDYWYRLFSKREFDDEAALKWVKHVYPELAENLQARDSALLLTAIQIKDKDIANRFEQSRANAIMLRNVSFGFFLLGIIMLAKFISSPNEFITLAISTACIVAAFITKRQARRFYQWFYRDIFKAALIYGTSLESVLNNIRSNAASSTPKNKTK